MSADASKLFEISSPLAKAFIATAHTTAINLQTLELKQQKEVKTKEEELGNRAAKLAEKEESLKREAISLEQKKKELSEAESKFIGESQKFKSHMMEREKYFKQQKDDFETVQTQVSAVLAENEQAIQIDVGGKLFKTSYKTLCRFPESTLAQLVNAKPDLPRSMFIDRDGQHFDFILRYLRSSDEEQIMHTVTRYGADTILDILEEAKYYNLRQLVKILKWGLIRYDTKQGNVFERIDGSLVTKEPPLGEVVNLRELNFAGNTFDQVHFKHNTSFQGSVLERSVFSKCKFEASVSFIDADLRRAKFVECEFTLPILVTGANWKDATLSSSNVCE